MTNVDEQRTVLERNVDVIVNGGIGGLEPTTVVDLTAGELRLVRQGVGAL